MAVRQPQLAIHWTRTPCNISKARRAGVEMHPHDPNSMADVYRGRRVGDGGD